MKLIVLICLYCVYVKNWCVAKSMQTPQFEDVLVEDLMLAVGPKRKQSGGSRLNSSQEKKNSMQSNSSSVTVNNKWCYA